MTDFYNLKVIDKQMLTPESVGITLQVEKPEIFKFTPGQFVMVEKEIAGKNLRRYYSIYSDVDDKNIKLGIKLKGNDGFAEYVMHRLKVGETLQVSQPMNDVPVQLNNLSAKNYLAITIGSGITPFYSIIQSMMKHEKDSSFTLIYGNHSTEKTMFYDELKELMHKYPERLKVFFVNSQNKKGDFYGRINQEIIEEVLEKTGKDFDAVFMIGPDDLKKLAAKTLLENGIDADKMHYRVYS